MDLPLATPELDHDALRETLSPCSMTVRDKGYSPPPTGSWQPVFSIPSKEVCVSTSTVTRQPRLSACSENPAHGFLQPKRACFSVFLSTPELNNTLFSSGDHFLHSASLQICLCPPITSFLSFLSKVVWV
jgi:hypothetical protein